MSKGSTGAGDRPAPTTAIRDFSTQDWRLLQDVILGAASGNPRRFEDALRQFDAKVEHPKRATAWMSFLTIYAVSKHFGRRPSDEELASLGSELEPAYRDRLPASAPPAATVLLFTLGRLPEDAPSPSRNLSGQQCVVVALIFGDVEVELLEAEERLIRYWQTEGPVVQDFLQGLA